MPYVNDRASMGWVGFVKLGTNVIRATSCDIKTSQEITYPEVVDGRADTTLYQLGPKVTGGTVAFPLVHDTATGSCITEAGSLDLENDNIVSKIWKLAVYRGPDSRLDQFDAAVQYTNSLSYLYPKCMVNTLSFTIAQSDAVQCSMEVWGGTGGVDRSKPIENGTTRTLSYLSPARVATWNDAVVALYGINGTTVLGRELREFSVTVNNNLERFYTLNGSLGVFDIAPKKREVSGTLKLMGHNPNLTAYAESNDSRFTSEAQIGFGFKIGGASTPYWATGLNGVIFEIEEVAISTGLFETSTKWRATGRCDAPNAAYNATYLGKAGAMPGGVTPTTVGSDVTNQAYGLKSIEPPTYTG